MSDLLLLMRHAAAGASPDGSDAARPLTPLGREQARRMGVALSRHLDLPVTVWASPARRCRETAELASRTLPIGGEVLVREELVLEGNAETLVQLVDHAPRPLLLVGHEPDLSNLALRLLGSSQALLFRPATCVALLPASRDARNWSVEFVLQADDLDVEPGVEP